MAVTEGLRGLPRIGLRAEGVAKAAACPFRDGVGGIAGLRAALCLLQIRSRYCAVNLRLFGLATTFHAADDGQGLAKINLGVAGRMRQRNKHLPPALSDTADVVLHNGDLARKAVLITQPLEYPLRCVTLLLRTILILFQDTVDNTDERIELRADRRPRPDITRWHRIAQHLPDRARVDPKTTSRFALAQTLNHYRVANPPIQFHSLHPPTLRSKMQRAIADGILLRRNQILRPLQ